MSKVLVFTTGGTIAMKPDPHGNGVVPAVSGADLLHAIPDLKNLGDIEVREFSNIPSCQMTPQKMHELAQVIKKALEEDEVTGAVVTHGTDTVEETAFYLDTVLDSPKPVVFTAAMRNAGGIGSDGPKNIFCAVKTAFAPEARGLGTLVVMNETIHAARDVTKSHAANPAAFESPWKGPVGYVDDDKVVIFRHLPPRQRFFPEKPGGEVHLLKMAAGTDARLIEHLVNAGAAGLVIEGFGRGNVPPAVQDAMLEAVRKGVPVVLASRCGAGRPAHEYGYAGGGKKSREGGVIFAGEMSGQKARLLLMLALGMGAGMEETRKYFENMPGGLTA